ncbi:hypothetical protein BJX96DRAFT_177882 [Aspergillus floccosus]
METKTSRKRDCFEIHGMYFDHDGIVFGECKEVIQIESFRGARSIKELPTYPLELHEDPDMRQRLVSNGRKFLAFRGSHHRQYQGHMFVPKDDELIQVHADGRVMIDAASFRRINPNYPRFQDRRPVKLGPYYTVLETVDRITGNCVNPDEMEEEDLASGPPGVGKTLTAEAIAEDLQRPLYSIKNVVKVARSVASSKGVLLSATYVRMTLRTNVYNVPVQGSAKLDASLYEG